MMWNKVAFAAIGSCVLHCVALFFLYAYPPTFLMRAHKEQQEAILEEGWLAEEGALERTRNLDEIFNEVVFLSPVSRESPFAFPLWGGIPREEAQVADLFSSVALSLQVKPAHDRVALPYTFDLCASMELDSVSSSLEHTPSISGHMLELYIATDMSINYIKEPSLDTVHPTFIETGSFSADTPISAGAVVFCKLTQLWREDAYVAALDAPAPLQHTRASIALSLPSIGNYAFAEHVAAVEEVVWQTPGINVEVHAGPNPYGKGIAFAITLTPEFDMQGHHMERTLHFFLDRSSTVDKYQFNTFKKATLKAIKALHEGDKFNIYVVGKNTEALGPQSLVVSRENVRKAEDFLDKQDAPPLLGKANVYTECARRLEPVLMQGDMHVAVIFPGPKATAHDKGQDLYDVYASSSGRFSLIIGALGERGDLDSLDLFARACGGELVHAVTYTSFARCVAKKVHDIREPVLVDAVLSVEAAQVFSAYPKVIYNRIPYTVTGTMETARDIRLHIEGYRNQRRISIDKQIVLPKENLTQNSVLQKALCMQNAILWYTLFLKEGEKSALQQSQTLYKKT